jgi:hypothetical protein
MEYRRDLTNHVFPWLGTTPIGRIRAKTLEELITHLNAGRRSRTPRSSACWPR